jgi:HD-GYP domain-containing protein (c-di-GMP phosphodiesterase class II)
MENNLMYVHHTVGPLQEPGCLSRRQHHLSNLMVVCNLSKELGDKESQEALLDWLVRHTTEFAPVAFSKVLTREPDGSYVCRAIFQNYPYNESFRKNQPVPAAAWPVYSRISNNGSEPTIIRQRDPGLSEEQRRALGLKHVRRLWIVPLKDDTEQIGVFILGERTGNPAKMKTSQVEMIARIADQAAIAIQGARRNTYLEESFIKIILALAEAINSTDPDSRNHGYRTANLAVALANHFSLTEEQIRNIRWASLLHDIGKVEISEEILCKPGPLSDEEWEIMRRHPVIGAELLQPVASLNGAGVLIQAHHERYDGSGYPYGLVAEEIPLEARILSVADAYSVMIQGRIYRSAFTQAETIAELKRCSGTDFDPQVVEALLELIERGTIY